MTGGHCPYCMKYFEYHKNWIKHQLLKHGNKKLWFDCKLLTVRQVYGSHGVLKQLDN